MFSAAVPAVEDAHAAAAAPAVAACKPKTVRKATSKNSNADRQAAAASGDCNPPMQQPAAAAPAAAITVTVATWNVKHFTCVQGTAVHLEKLKNVAQDIIRIKADIVVLQEVSCESSS
jgi:L-lactate permease